MAASEMESQELKQNTLIMDYASKLRQEKEFLSLGEPRGAG